MNDLASTSSEDAHGWSDDVLNRKGLADFLTTSLSEQARSLSKSRNLGLTVALDADWGSGKSFFVRHWAADLRAAGHPVVFFDAWENDIGDEAAVALMASIKSELEAWNEKLPKKKAIRSIAAESTRSAVKGLRRAIAPASKAIAIGVLRKATGIAVDEIFAAVEGERDVLLGTSEQASSVLESGLDELFKRAMDEHSKRGRAIVDFRTSIGNLIQILEDEANAAVPVFVFVDEVDRCRPTYAIKLLEEIKHVFGVPKICFVVSTNLDQLRESVRAIYGAGFDGRRYLKRFFDREYTLPKPNNESFASQLLSEESALTDARAATGLPQSTSKGETRRAIATVFNSFGLDLRSQKQVFSIAASVAAAVPQDRKVFTLWLFFLCALQHTHPHLLDSILKRDLDHKEFSEICREALKVDVIIEYVQPRNSYERSPMTSRAKFSDVAWSYYQWSNGDLLKLREAFSSTNAYSYPASNLGPIAAEAPNPFDPGGKYPPSIANYAEWVKYAGMAYQQGTAAEES